MDCSFLFPQSEQSGMQGWRVGVHPGKALVMFQTPTSSLFVIELFTTLSDLVAGIAFLVTYIIAQSCTFLHLADCLISLVPGHGEQLHSLLSFRPVI